MSPRQAIAKTILLTLLLVSACALPGGCSSGSGARDEGKVLVDLVWSQEGSGVDASDPGGDGEAQAGDSSELPDAPLDAAEPQAEGPDGEAAEALDLYELSDALPDPPGPELVPETQPEIDELLSELSESLDLSEETSAELLDDAPELAELAPELPDDSAEATPEEADAVEEAPDTELTGEEVLSCEPFALRCAGEQEREQCDQSGSAWTPLSACPAKEFCHEGECLSLCSLGSDVAEGSYGCEYLVVDLPNLSTPSWPGDAAPFALVVANTYLDVEAHLLVADHEGLLPGLESLAIAPGELGVIHLPRADLEGSAVAPAAYRLVADVPLAAYQFNPLLNEGVFSNDASLLFPSSSLGQDFMLLSWPQTATESVASTAFVSIVALVDGTTVRLRPSADVQGSGGSLGEIGAAAGDEILQQLDALDVWQVSTVNGSLAPSTPSLVLARDLSGSLIQSDQPVAVFTGVECARVPADTPACDHLEQQIPPYPTWGRRVLLAAAKRRHLAVDHYRVLIGRDGTELSASLPLIPATPPGGWRAGDLLDFATPNDLELSADGPILVGQFLSGRLAQAEIGDPSFLVLPPVEQYRTSYVFLGPTTYEESYANVVAPVGATVTLSPPAVDEVITSFEGAGGGSESSAWTVRRLRIEPGRHELNCSVPCGVTVYGWSHDVSYAYPAGQSTLTLHDEPLPLPPALAAEPCTNGAPCPGDEGCGRGVCNRLDGACALHDLALCPAPACYGTADCEDLNPCTDDLCSVAGACLNQAIPDCVVPCASPADCIDGDPCTDDYCGVDPPTCYWTANYACPGACTYDSECDDDWACTDDHCESDGWQCSFTKLPACPCKDYKDCDDLDPCTTDICTAPINGFCKWYDKQNCN